MFLTLSNLAHYLLARGLLGPDDVVDGNFLAVEAGRRNRNFKIFRGGQPGLFVKQLSMVMPELIQAIHREAACYQLIQEHPGFAELGELTLRLRDYDPRRHTLTVELLDPSENLNELHRRVATFPTLVGDLLGRALATYQGAATRMLADPTALSFFPRSQPWVLAIAQNAETVMPNMSPASRHVVALLRQSPELYRGLAFLQAAWQPHCLLHGDIKFDNLLIQERGAEQHLRIIDWELADIGDSAWDVAGVLVAYVQAWLLAVPVDRSQPDPAVMIPSAPFKLEAVWPALRAFWNSYARARGFTAGQLEHQRFRCVSFAAARLVLTAFEISQASSEPSPIAERFVRLARAVFAEPQRAMVELFGLGADSTVVEAPRPPSGLNTPVHAYPSLPSSAEARNR